MAATDAASGKRVTVSLPAELVEPLEKSAASEDRSLSGQIVNIIRQWAAGRRRSVTVSDAEFESLVREVRDHAARDDRTVPPTLQRLIDRSYGG
jgi:hypothetical protein